MGIRFSELADTNEYEEASSAFVKITDTGDGVEFTESPGHSEIAVGYEDFYQNIESTQQIIYRVGDVLCRDLSTTNSNTHLHKTQRSRSYRCNKKNKEMTMELLLK